MAIGNRLPLSWNSWVSLDRCREQIPSNTAASFPRISALHCFERLLHHLFLCLANQAHKKGSVQ